MQHVTNSFKVVRYIILLMLSFASHHYYTYYIYIALILYKGLKCGTVHSIIGKYFACAILQNILIIIIIIINYN